jgi:hypothetical protein
VQCLQWARLQSMGRVLRGFHLEAAGAKKQGTHAWVAAVRGGISTHAPCSVDMARSCSQVKALRACVPHPVPKQSTLPRLFTSAAPVALAWKSI